MTEKVILYQPGLPLQSQDILLSGDLHLLRVDAWHGELENEALGRLEQVRGYATATPLSHIARRDKTIFKQAIHCLAQRDHFTEGVVTG